MNSNLTARPSSVTTAIARTLSMAALCALTTLAGCGRESAPAADPKAQASTLRYQGSVGMVTYPELAQDLGYLAPLKLDWIGNTVSGPQDIQTVVTGDVEFGTAFNGAVAKLIAAKAPIRAVVGSYGVDEHTWGGFYVLDGSPIKGPRDLIGKKVAVNTLGAHSEFVLRQKQVDVAVLGNILRDKALERGGIRKLFSDHDLYGNFTAGTYVFTNEFIAKNPDSVRRFVEGVSKAIEWARVTPRDEVRARYAAIINKRGRNEDTTLVGYWQSTGIAEPGGSVAEREFQIWVDWLVKEGELKPGQLRPADLYTNEYNPLAKPAAAAAAAAASAAAKDAS